MSYLSILARVGVCLELVAAFTTVFGAMSQLLLIFMLGVTLFLTAYLLQLPEAWMLRRRAQERRWREKQLYTDREYCPCRYSFPYDTSGLSHHGHIYCSMPVCRHAVRGRQLWKVREEWKAK